MQDKNNIISALGTMRASMSKSHKKIADFVCEHYDKAAFMTAAKLGEEVGVSDQRLFVLPRSLATMAIQNFSICLKNISKTN